MIVGITSFTLLSGMISTWIFQDGDKEKKLAAKLDIMREFYKRYDVPEKTKIKVARFFEEDHERFHLTIDWNNLV